MNIRKIINYKLEKLNITKYALSKVLNTTPSNIYTFLEGGRRSVGAEKMLSIANIIGLSSTLALFVRFFNGYFSMLQALKYQNNPIRTILVLF